MLDDEQYWTMNLFPQGPLGSRARSPTTIGRIRHPYYSRSRKVLSRNIKRVGRVEVDDKSQRNHPLPACLTSSMVHLDGECAMKMLVAGLAVCFLSAVPSGAFGQDDWRTFQNDLMRIEYPADLFGPGEEIGGGVVFGGRDARIELSAMEVPELNGVSELRALIDRTEGYEDVTYSPGGNRWLVVSGYRGDDIFYEKFFLKGGSVGGFSVQYPRLLRETYDPIVERMEDSFISR
jgi:hypothetical protein